MAASASAAPARPGSRLTVDDWIDAGFALIAEEGMRAVKIDRLCERLGVTKGSFYWHFSDVGAYFRALAEDWGRHSGQGAPRSRTRRRSRRTSASRR